MAAVAAAEASMEKPAAQDEENDQKSPLELDADGDDRSIERSALRKIVWRIIPLVALAEWIGYVDKTNIAFASVGACFINEVQQGDRTMALAPD